MIYPKFIKENDTIGIPAPSAGAANKEKKYKMLNAKKNLEIFLINKKQLYSTKLHFFLNIQHPHPNFFPPLYASVQIASAINQQGYSAPQNK